jgi:hypothetical protein
MVSSLILGSILMVSGLILGSILVVFLRLLVLRLSFILRGFWWFLFLVFSFVLFIPL